MPYETDVKRMEEIAQTLRDNKTPLEEAIKLFEDGVLIANRVEKELNELERKVEVLLNPPDSEELEARTAPFETP